MPEPQSLVHLTFPSKRHHARRPKPHPTFPGQGFSLTEGDLFIGKDQGSAIGTLVERQTRMVRLLHLAQRDGDTLQDALKARMADLPALLRSITWDRNRNGPSPHNHPITRRPGLTSATPTHPGSAARTKTPMGCFVTTSPR